MTQAMHRPLVTVAIVTLNAAAELPGTLRSIARQTWQEKEVLVVDGGSTDGTIAMLRDPASGVTRWESGKDRGPYDAMNKAAALASGEWIIFMNAGDWFADPQAIEHALRDVPPDADFVIGHHLYRLLDGSMVLHKAADFEETWSRLRASDFSFRWLSGIPCHQATFTRTALLLENPYDIGFRIAADHDLMFRMRAAGARFHHGNTVVAVYTQGGMSTNQEALCFHEWWRIGCTFGKPAPSTRFFQENFRPGVTEHPRRVAEVTAQVRASGLFFEDWYRALHPRDRLVDPVEHYMYVGWKQGFAPNPFFDPAFYVARYADARAAGGNPFEHYLNVGRAENRLTFDWADASRPLAALRGVFDPQREGLEVLIRRIAEMPSDQLARLLAPFAPPPPPPVADENAPPADGSWSLVGGASEHSEGPYPQLGLDAPFRWSIGAVTTLRVFSAKPGRRRLRLVVRNALGGQRLAIGGEGVTPREAPLPVADISVPVPVEVTLDGPPGYRDIEIRPSRQSQPDGVGRHLTFILEAVTLEDPEEARAATLLGDIAAPLPAPIEAALLKRQDAETVLWEMSDGVGALEGPAPEIGLPHHFRWITARRCRLLLEAPAARHATLRLDYRCPIAGQRAILRVNDDPAQFLRLDSGALTESFRLEIPVRLKPGRSAVEFMLSETTREVAGERDLALLIEDLAIV